MIQDSWDSQLYIALQTTRPEVKKISRLYNTLNQQLNECKHMVADIPIN